MFTVIALQVCLLTGPCANLNDRLGPYPTIEACESRLDFIISHYTQGFYESYSYVAVCSEINGKGQPVGPLKQYIRPGDTVQQ